MIVNICKISFHIFIARTLLHIFVRISIKYCYLPDTQLFHSAYMLYVFNYSKRSWHVMLDVEEALQTCMNTRKSKSCTHHWCQELHNALPEFSDRQLRSYLLIYLYSSLLNHLELLYPDAIFKSLLKCSFKFAMTRTCIRRLW